MKALLVLVVLLFSVDSFSEEKCDSSIEIRNNDGSFTSICVQDQSQVKAQDNLLSKLEAGALEMQQKNQ